MLEEAARTLRAHGHREASGGLNRAVEWHRTQRPRAPNDETLVQTLAGRSTWPNGGMKPIECSHRPP